MASITTSPLAAVTSGQYEQAMIQGAVRKRITIFKHLQKTYSSNSAKTNRIGMKLENIGVILFSVQKMISKEYILNKKAFQRSLPLHRVCSRLRTANYMILGMSVSGLLELQSGAMEYLKAFNQLLYEYEYHSTHEPGSLSGKPKMVVWVRSNED
jgi:hypothetical protein